MSEEQVQRILSRVKPAMKKWLNASDLLPFLKRHHVLTNSELSLLNSSTLAQREQVDIRQLRPGKLNSLFIVAARMDFQIFSKKIQISDCIQQLYDTLALPPQALQLKGVGSAIASWNLAFLALFY